MPTTDCEFKESKWPNIAEVMKSITDPGLKLLMAAQMSCGSLKGAACSANSDSSWMGMTAVWDKPYKSYHADPTMLSIPMPGGGGGGGTTKGDKCKGLSKIMDAVVANTDMDKQMQADADVQMAVPTDVHGGHGQMRQIKGKENCA